MVPEQLMPLLRSFPSAASGFYKYASPPGFAEKRNCAFCRHPERMDVIQPGVDAQRLFLFFLGIIRTVKQSMILDREQLGIGRARNLMCLIGG